MKKITIKRPKRMVLKRKREKKQEMLISCTFSFWHYKCTVHTYACTHASARPHSLTRLFSSLQLRIEREWKSWQQPPHFNWFLYLRRQREHQQRNTRAHMSRNGRKITFFADNVNALLTVMRRVCKRSKILLTQSVRTLESEAKGHSDASEMVYGKSKQKT